MAKQVPSNDYVQTINPEGYVNNREITNLPGQRLVKGSQNCLIENKEKVISRKGYSLVGAAKTKNKGHRGSFDWKTNSNLWRNLRFNLAGELEVWYGSAWHLLKQYPQGTSAEFTTWWDSTELIDQLLFVIGDASIRSWSGAITKIASSTATTLTKTHYVSGTDIAFNDNGADADTIVKASGGFTAAVFAVGESVVISGSATNDGTYTIDAVTDTTITLVVDDSLETEAAGASVVVKEPYGTWAESRFLTTGTRSVSINGVEYAYTGGENTGTLTGLTVTGTVDAGDIAFQAIKTVSPAALAGFVADRISVIYNYVFVGSTRSQVVYIASASDYTDFSNSANRKVGEGFDLTLDNTTNAFAPDEDQMYISSGHDDWYKIQFVLSAATAGDESVVITKLKTATGQAAVSQGAVVNIKNAIAFFSQEPTVDTLGRVESIDTPQSVPISDEIRLDLQAYDTSGVHGIFHDRNLYYALPAEGVLLIYNTRFQYWQPPQLMPIGRLALIDINGDGKLSLCGHSSVSNETYKLFDGYTDNGAGYRVVVAFGYENYGSRFMTKSFDELATEIYMSTNTKVLNRCNYDYKGATDVREFELDGADEACRFAPRVLGGPLGNDNEGQQPLGSAQNETDDLSKYRFVDTTTVLDFFERQRVYVCDSPEPRFEILAYGENVEMSDNIPAYLKR